MGPYVFSGCGVTVSGGGVTVSGGGVTVSGGGVTVSGVGALSVRWGSLSVRWGSQSVGAGSQSVGVGGTVNIVKGLGCVCGSMPLQRAGLVSSQVYSFPGSTPEQQMMYAGSKTSLVREGEFTKVCNMHHRQELRYNVCWFRSTVHAVCLLTCYRVHRCLN